MPKIYTLFGIDESFLATNCSSLEPRWGINRIDVYSGHTRTVKALSQIPENEHLLASWCPAVRDINIVSCCKSYWAIF